LLKAIDNATCKPFQTGERLPWICMLAMLMYTQLVPGAQQVFLPFDLVSQKNLVFSTVSATLLRSSTRKWKFSGQYFLASTILLWQIVQTGNLIAGLSAVFSQFSTVYMSCLTTFPLYTKALTTAVISVMGDTTAQILEERIRAKKKGTQFSFSQNYDRRRGLSIVADSILVTGPLLHFAYNWLEHLIPVAGATGSAASLAALAQVLIDNCILDSFFVAIMFVTTGIAEGYDAKQIIPQIKKDYFATVKTSWATSFVLMPLQFVCFRFLPLSFRVLGVNFIDIFWQAMVSYMVHRRRRGEMKDEAVAVPAMA
jgi:hypothetical protein